MQATLQRDDSTPPARRKWTKQEDEQLLIAVDLQSARSGQSSNWKAVAEHIPGRTNKDCRKRWIKIKTSTTKGTWDPTEDARLRNAVGKHGFRWVEVARDVGTRNSDQCAKRWNYAVDPSIDRSVWKPVEDAALIFAVSKYGPAWRVISEEYFPRRATTDIKNRHIIITGDRRRAQILTRKQSRRLISQFPDTPTSPDVDFTLRNSPLSNRTSPTCSLAEAPKPENAYNGLSGEAVECSIANSGSDLPTESINFHSEWTSFQVENAPAGVPHLEPLRKEALLDSLLDELINSPFDFGQPLGDFDIQVTY